MAAASQADYLIEQSWVQHAHPRVLELAPPEGDSDDVVRRLLLPRHVQDLRFLQLLPVEHLRVELWPHRSSEPHMHVRILTDAFSFYPAAEQQRPFWLRWPSPDKQWFLLLQAVVHLPPGVALLGCSPQWRWADVNETELLSFKEVVGSPFRVLEVACPRRPRGFLLPSRMSGSARFSTTGSGAPRDMLIRGCRLAFLVMLIVVCIAQVVLLLICITMLLVQMGMQRARPAVV